MTFSTRVPQSASAGNALTFGALLMWAGFITVLLAVVIQMVNRNAPLSYGLPIFIGLALIDALCIWRNLGTGSRRNLWLFVDGALKFSVVMFLMTMLIMTAARGRALTPSPLDDLIGPSLFLTGPLTMLASVFRKLER